MKPKISICIPSRGRMWVKTGVCVAMLHAYNLKKYGYSKIHYAFGRTESNRNNLAKRAIESGSTHVLYIDTDMVFPENSAEILYDSGMHVIACNAAITNEDSETCGKPVIINNVNGNPMDYSKEIEEVPVIGMALALIRTDVFFELELPWFSAPERPGETNVMSEDVFFCHKVRKVGRRVFCHNLLSRQIGHLGAKTRYLFQSDEIGLIQGLKKSMAEIEKLKEKVFKKDKDREDSAKLGGFI